tara:strand:+ start:794 stop:1210 length:417 start_codon:yes stop_codon:yes gene_type:complete
LNKFFCILISSLLLFSSGNSDDKINFKLESYQGVVLKILNKVSTNRFEIISPIGQYLELQEHKLIIFRCVVLDKNKNNEHLALIKFEPTEKNENFPEFLGWLVKSSPSLNGVEHPIFDIKLENCLENDPLFPNVKSIK